MTQETKSLALTGRMIYDRTDALTFAKTLGEWIHKSQFFGTAAIEQGCILAMEVMHRGVPVMRLAEQYHVIFGKLSMKADYMVAQFQAMGGKLKVVERTDKRAAAEFVYEDNKLVFSFSWDEACLEPIVYEFKRAEMSDVIQKITDPKERAKLKLKAMYSTPRARMQMLWARMVSDAVRTLCPQVNCGAYVPEELGGAPDTGGDANVDVVEADFTVVPETKQVPPETAPLSGDPLAPATETKQPVAETKTPVAETKPVVTETNGPINVDRPVQTGQMDERACTTEQANEIHALFGECQLNDGQMKSILAKRSVNAVRSLTTSQAAELIVNLRGARDKAAKARQQKEADDKATTAAPGPEQFTRLKTDPITEDEYKQIQGELKSASQRDSKVHSELKASLERAGIKLRDISAADFEQIMPKLKLEKLDEFFRFVRESSLGVAKS